LFEIGLKLSETSVAKSNQLFGSIEVAQVENDIFKLGFGSHPLLFL